METGVLSGDVVLNWIVTLEAKLDFLMTVVSFDHVLEEELTESETV